MRQLVLYMLMLLLPSMVYANGHNQIVLDFKDNVTQQQIEDFNSKYGITSVPNSIYSDAEKLQVSSYLADEDIHRLVASMHADPLLEHVEPMQIYSIPNQELWSGFDGLKSVIKGFPDDPFYKYQWHMNAIHMPEAWQLNAGKGAIVAVIDTGVAYENFKDPDTGETFKQVADLNKTCFVPGYDFVNDDAHANDDHAHGTHVAGTIAQSTNNGIGVTGIAYQACIMPIKVLSGQGGGTSADVAEGIRWAADHGAHVINMSLGSSSPSAVIRDACDYAKKKGVTIVAAAGNGGTDKVGYPAAYAGVIAVSATDLSDKITFYSQYGEDIDIAAPGGDTSADRNGDGVPDGVVQNTIKTQRPTEEGYFPFMGTSMATPHVAGVAAQIVSLGIKNPSEVEKILFASADRKPAYDNGAPKDSKWDNKYGFGRLDSLAACKLAKKSKDMSYFTDLLNTSSLSIVGLVVDQYSNFVYSFNVVPHAEISNPADPYLRPVYLNGLLGLIIFAFVTTRLNRKQNLRFNKSYWHMFAGVLGTLLGSAGLMLLAAPFPSLLGYTVFPAVLLIGLLGSTSLFSLAAGFSLGTIANLFYCAVNNIDLWLPFSIANDLWLLLSAITVSFLGYFTLAKK